MHNLNPFIAPALAALCLAGCGAGSSSLTPAQSRALTPADPDLAALYTASCKACHTVPASRAPMTGSARAWGVRMNKGMDRLLENTISGYKGMPPMGLCSDCSESDLRDLISFMATPPEPADS